MLKLYAIVRFALSRSPTREQREMAFADQPIKKDPSATSLPAGERPREGADGALGNSEGVSPVDQGTQETHADVRGILDSIDTQQLFEEMKSGDEAELFDRLTEREETLAGVDVVSAARSAGIEISVQPQTPPQQALKQILALDSASGIPPTAKRQFVLELLRLSPRVTTALLHGLLDRLSTFEEQQRILDVCREKLGDNGFPEAVKAAQGTQSLDDSLTNWKTKNDLRGARSWPRTTMVNAVKALRVTQGFGARFWGGESIEPKKDDQRRQAYLESLRTEIAKLSALFCAQVRSASGEIGSRLEKRVASLIQGRTRGTLTTTDDLTLKQAGEIIDRLQNRIATRVPSPEALPASTTSEFTAQCTGTFQTFDEVTQSLEEIRKDADALDSRWQKETHDEKREAQKAHDWAERCAPMITAVLQDSTLDITTSAALRSLQEQLKDPQVPIAMNDEQRTKQEYVLRTLVEKGEGYFLLAKQEAARLEQAVKEELKSRNREQWAQEKQKELQGLQGTLKPLLEHPVCTALEIPGQVDTYAAELIGQLNLVQQAKIEEADDEHGKEAMCVRIGSQIAHFRTAVNLLSALESSTNGEIPPEGNAHVAVLSPEAFVAKYGVENATACFDEGKIWIRSDLQGEKRRSAIQHEKAHFIFSILSDQSFLFPDLLEKTYGDLSTQAWQTLEGRAADWGISREAIRKRYHREHPEVPEDLLKQRVEARYRRSLLEESAVSGSLAQAGTRDKEIFDQLNRERHGDSSEMLTAEGSTPLFQTDNDQFPDEEERPSESTSISTAAYDAKEDLEEIERMIMAINNFGEAYGTNRDKSGRNFNPAFKEQADEILGHGHGDGGYRDVLDSLRHIFLKGETRDDHRPVDPALDTTYRDTVSKFKQHVGKTAESVQKLDQKFSEGIDEAPKERKQTIAQKLGVHMLCVLDVIRIYKEFKEDIEGMWHSMQDGKTADAKAALSHNLPVKIPGTNIKIPIIGKYTERLPHYTERARNSKELERVKKWEDAFTNLDADELLDLIGKTPTRDQLRASIELLVKKGRMAWGDEGVWKALNEKSNFRMPFGPCRANEVTRDKWLHKLVTDIWKDKDMFNEWMTGNSGNYDKHKKSYTHEGDNFSNIAGQMGHELRSMLKTYVECKSAVPPKPLPEQVNPHHYEELLEYAMRNGKMRMEDKMFYLIQGIASGFMPIERLRVLSGEKGGILSKFPFLDYFYTRHNSMKEIKHLAGRLREDGDPYKPGVKTTLFMRLVVLRDVKVRERMTKASARKMEEIDHEDVPYLATDVDYVIMQNLLGNVSGERWKITVQGWKNAYVGFNEKFKMYAQLARMARQGKARFSPQDVSDLAQTIASYVVMDNKLSGAAAVNKEAQLSKQNLESEVPVANSDLTTATFRNRSRDFVGDLVRSVGMTDADLKTGLTLDQFLASSQRDQTQLFDDKYKKNMIATIEPFAKAIITKIEEHPEVIMDKLIEWEGRSFNSGGKFLDSFTGADGDSPVTNQTVDREYPKLNEALD